MSTDVQALHRRIDAQSRQIEELQRLRRPQEPRAAFAEARARADAVTQKYFEYVAPGPLAGESVRDYRIRLAALCQPYSKRYERSDLSRVQDEVAFSAIESEIFNDAARSVSDPSTFRPGELRPVYSVDDSGRTITRYVGDPLAAWAPYMASIKHVRKFLVPGS